jgi:phage protein D
MPQAQNYLSQMYFKIGGQSPSAKLMDLVREIVVDTSLYLPDMFSIHFDDPSLTLIDSPDLEIGKSVEISGKAPGDTSSTPMVKGEIVAVEPEFTEDKGMTIVIRGYDKSHRLHRGKKSRVFQQSTDSDIVKKIAGKCGLDYSVDPTSTVHEHVFQDNQTDMEFIHDRARRVGYVAYVDQGELNFRKAGEGSPAATLEWGKDLTDFQARLTSAGQVNSSEVHGWDMKKKKAITGEKKSPTNTPTVDSQNHGGNLASKAFGIKNITEVVNNRPVSDQSEADTLALSVLNDRCHAFFQAEGTCFGNTKVRAGKKVTINGIGSRFSGSYSVTRAVHRYDLSGYTTQFEISGYQANTMRHLLAGGEKNSPYGAVVGIVTNVKDPDGLARVKVKYPTIDEKLESNWARLVTPMAGKQRGFEFIPEVNDEVLIAFEYNDINRPYVIGALWNGMDKPPEDSTKLVNGSGEVQKRVIKSRSGHTITFDDTQSAEQITIIDKSGQKVVLDSSSGKEKIEIIDKGGSKIVMDGTKRSVSIESAQDLTIQAKGKVQIEGQTGIDINTTGNLALESKANTSIKGMQTSVQGNGSAELKANGMVTVQGSGTTELKSSGIVIVQGSLVKIN